ncbi:MAG: radical SAM protein [Helicobacteraceae bacterium]|jgi:anaerobic ribonucleoside-triphosphate reductase activating protein|nr:radical SAM protein [Helicobacteraceae bacterium]
MGVTTYFQPKFNVACINRCTEAEGPEKRLAIWFQGCDKRCKGCCNPELLKLKPAHILTLDELLLIIAEAKKRFGIEGVTYLGGEPALQQGLAELSRIIRTAGLGAILFTGKQESEVRADLKAEVDLIIDGGFEQNKLDDKRNLVGSTNQRLVFITDRYRPHKQWFYASRPKRVEINVADGLFITGDKI